MPSFDVERLVNAWESMREAFAPSPELFARTLWDADPIDPELAELSLLSGRRETWALLVTLVGYASDNAIAPGAILQGIDTNTESGLDLEVQPFLEYVRQFSSVDGDALWAAEYAVRQTLPGERLRLTVATFEIATECALRYPVPPDSNRARLRDCIRQGLGGAGGMSFGRGTPIIAGPVAR